MDRLYSQNILEQTLPYYRERREKDGKESPTSQNEGLGRVRHAGDEFPDEELYFEIPYEGGSAGKHLNTLA